MKMKFLKRSQTRIIIALFLIFIFTAAFDKLKNGNNSDTNVILINSRKEELDTVWERYSPVYRIVPDTSLDFGDTHSLKLVAHADVEQYAVPDSILLRITLQNISDTREISIMTPFNYGDIVVIQSGNKIRPIGPDGERDFSWGGKSSKIKLRPGEIYSQTFDLKGVFIQDNDSGMFQVEVPYQLIRGIRFEINGRRKSGTNKIGCIYGRCQLFVEHE